MNRSYTWNLENVSEETVKENRVAISSPDDILGDSPQRLQQEISIEHCPHMSIDEILKVIKGANGMPVLFVPSSDGRLAAVAVDGLQNLVLQTNGHDNGSADKKQQNFRAWLMFLTSLVATVTYTAGLTPPGGFWAADDKANGYVAGTSVMSSKFHTRYLIFYYRNATAFISSLLVIGMLAKSINSKKGYYPGKLYIPNQCNYYVFMLGD
ncbi:hypothetical protein ACQ4PT_049893 [Festuca glaucescens]